MKTTYQTPSGRLSFEFEASTQKEVFAQVAELQEIFEEEKCGKCGSERIRFDYHEPKGFAYYKMRCMDCNATLDFGQSKDMKTLFIKRKDDDMQWLPCHGWYVYTGDTAERPAEHPPHGYASKPAEKPPKHQDVRPVKAAPMFEASPALAEPMTVGDAAEKALHVKTLKEADAIMQRCASLAGLQKAWSENWAGGSWAPKTKLALVDLVTKHKTRLGWKPAQVPA